MQLKEKRSGFDSSNRIQTHTVSPPLRCFVGAVLPSRYVAEMDPATRYTLRCNTREYNENFDLFYVKLLFLFLSKMICE